MQLHELKARVPVKRSAGLVKIPETSFSSSARSFTMQRLARTRSCGPVTCLLFVCHRIRALGTLGQETRDKASVEPYWRSAQNVKCW